MSKATNHCHLVEQGDKALVFFLLTETYMRQKLRHEKNGEKKRTIGCGLWEAEKVEL